MVPAELKRFTHIHPKDESNKGHDVRSGAVDWRTQLFSRHMPEDCWGNNREDEWGGGGRTRLQFLPPLPGFSILAADYPHEIKASASEVGTLARSVCVGVFVSVYAAY